MQRLRPGLEVSLLDPDARTIMIAFKEYNPELCYDLTLALAGAYQEYDDEIKRRGSENILKFIDKQLDSLFVEQRASKDSLNDFHVKSQVVDPEMNGASLTDDVSQMQEDLFMLENEISDLESIDSRLEKSLNRIDVFRMIPEMLGKSFEVSLANHVSELHDLLEAKEDLLFSYTAENEKVKENQRKVDNKISTIQRSISTIISRLETDAQRLKIKIRKAEGQLSGLPEKRMEYNRLKNISELNEKYLTLLREKKLLYFLRSYSIEQCP